MDQDYDVEEILEPSPECCIYRIPEHLRKINEEAYTPSLISIGPLHYGRKALMRMENQKRRYWSNFGQRVNAEILKEFRIYIEAQELRIRDNYSVTSTLLNSNYITIILYDAVFIIELFLRKYQGINDFLLQPPLRETIEKDLLLLENQLPYFVLNDLFTIAFPHGNPSLFDLSLNCFFWGNDLSFLAKSCWQSKHLTDFNRFMVLQNKPPHVESDSDEMYDLPCATKLYKSGLKFRRSDNSFWLDISLKKRKPYRKWFPWFEVNELEIPAIVIHDSTECLFRNLMAFEMFHYPRETSICHYVALMNKLIDTKKDVDLLVEKGIVVNYVGDNEAIAKMFNRLLSQVVLSPNFCYNDIFKKIKAYYRYPWNQARAILKSVAVAATLLMILTVIQTLCSIMQLGETR